MIEINEEIKLSKKNKQKIIHTYIEILKNTNLISKSHLDIRKKLTMYFNFNVTKEEISEYFEPTVVEQSLDNQISAKNTGIIYE